MSLSFYKITGDDFGYCPKRNQGILELVDKGILNSVSVLVNGKFLDKAIIETTARAGLHLNLTEGLPVTQQEKVKSLLKKNGLFSGKFGFREKLHSNCIKLCEVELECEAQIGKFKDIFGDYPKYIDGHQHIHVLPGVREIFARLLPKYNIYETRRPFELAIENCNWIEEPRLNFYKSVCSDAKDATVLWERQNIMFPMYFIGLSTMSHDLNQENLTSALQLVYEDRKRKNNCSYHRFIELMFHPGYPSDGVVGGCGEGPDEFSRSEDRLYEQRFLSSSIFIETLTTFSEKFRLLTELCW